MAGRSTQPLEGMSRRIAINVAVASALIFGAAVVSALSVVGLVHQLECGGTLAYDYDTGACEPTTEHPSSKQLWGFIIAGVAALGLGAGGAALIIRSRRLR